MLDDVTQKKLMKRIIDGRPGYVEVPIALYEQLVGMLVSPHEHEEEPLDAISEIGFVVPEDDD